jgi:hypothetical protein
VKSRISVLAVWFFVVIAVTRQEFLNVTEPILIAQAKQPISLLTKMPNRYGLIAGASARLAADNKLNPSLVFIDVPIDGTLTNYSRHLQSPFWGAQARTLPFAVTWARRVLNQQ